MITRIVYTGCMIANHANQVILDNLVKKNGAFDVGIAYQAMKEQVSLLWSVRMPPQQPECTKLRFLIASSMVTFHL